MSNKTTSKAYRIAGAAMFAFGMFIVFVIGLPWFVGFAALVVGVAFFLTPTIIDGVPWLIRRIWSSAEPVWEGEILHTDSGDSKIRYGFDPKGCPWFVAQDVCRAIGTQAPSNRAQDFNGTRLVRRNNLCCFTESSVGEYLARLAIENHDAKRLLVLLKTQVLRRVEKDREQKRLYG